MINDNSIVEQISAAQPAQLSDSQVLSNSQISSSQDPSTASASFIMMQLKKIVWLIGIALLIFGMADRGIAAFTHGYVSTAELLNMFTISLLLASWLSLKPESQADSMSDQVPVDDTPFVFQPASAHLEVTQSRMAELQDYHLINQSYILPFPYFCQIYHLLNLKHLETIHSFSLNNLKVVKVSHQEQTNWGGIVKFQTVLDSPLNVLRIWRQSMIEAQLTLHSPYTVELGIPVYGDKVIIVLFNTVPISHTEHQFCVDIYSNLQWYKPLLKLMLHFAAILTLLEDLPYLKALAQTRIQRLVNVNKTINQEMMWLFGRFVSLYGSSVNHAEIEAEAVEPI